MKAILLMCAVSVACVQIQAQVGTAFATQQAVQQMQMQQQLTQDNSAPFLSKQCEKSSGQAVAQAIDQFTNSNPFSIQQVQSLTAGLQTGFYYPHIPLWGSWQVVPVKDQMSFSVKPGVVKPGTKVRIRWRDAGHGVTVYYTTDGWSPNPSSRLDNGPITILGPTHIQAIQISWGSGKDSCQVLQRSRILDAYYDVVPSNSPVRSPAVITHGLLRAGTELKVVTDGVIDSNFAKPGDKVSLLLDQNVMVGNIVLIPKGTRVEAVLAEAISPQASRTGGVLVVAARSLKEKGVSIRLHGVETMEGRPGVARKRAVIEPGMSFQAVVTSDVNLKS